MSEMKSLSKWCEEITEKVKTLQKENPLKNEIPKKAEVIQLPLWPEETRAVPNGVLRSALFGVIKKGKRKYLKKEMMASLDGVEVFYTGERLNQDDLDVWENVLHVARLQEMETKCQFTAYSFLKLLGKSNSGSNIKILHERLTRLRANAVEIKQGRYTYVGGLIDEFYQNEITKEYVVVINAKLRPLFSKDQYTQIDWDIRRSLEGKPLAQWLHGFYSSHAKPYPVSVSTLHRLCGSEASRMNDYRRDLRKALEALKASLNGVGEFFEYEIDSKDLVHVSRQPSAAQQRHLLRKQTKAKSNKK